MSGSGRLEVLLTRFNNWETEAEMAEYIDNLESMLEECNKAHANGEELVPDAIYDTLMDFLREVKPDSHLLHQVWSVDDPNVEFEEDYDKFLLSYPMLSIQTVKHVSDKPVKDFKEKLPVGPIEVCNTIKENGHAIRVVWESGHLVKATSRGRSTNGRDLTRHARLILGEYNEGLSMFGLVEMRGEALLPFSNLEKARQFNPSIKSAFTGVSSMIRESATDEEAKLLDIIFFDVLCDNLETQTLSEKLDFIKSLGFNVPLYFVSEVNRRTLEQDLEEIVHKMDLESLEYDYYTDGVIVQINDNDLFNEFGAEDKFRLGNLALKIGRWKQDMYTGIIKEIKWEHGKSKLTPVAVLEEGVLTATGNTVVNIPLYAPIYILLLEAYIGNPIHFRYGGEAGVIPITADGRLVTELTK